MVLVHTSLHLAGPGVTLTINPVSHLGGNPEQAFEAMFGRQATYLASAKEASEMTLNGILPSCLDRVPPFPISRSKASVTVAAQFALSRAHDMGLDCPGRRSGRCYILMELTSWALSSPRSDHSHRAARNTARWCSTSFSGVAGQATSKPPKLWCVGQGLAPGQGP